MAIDQAALCRAYYNPPPEGRFLGVPSREEYTAEAERWFVQLCLDRGGDPEAEGLGEYGALIGGPGKPVRSLVGHSRPFENYARPRLAPLSWFERPAVRTGSTRQDRDHQAMHGLIVSCMAGVPDSSRPSARQLYAAFLSESPGDLERFWLHAVLSCVTMLELRRMMHAEGLSIRTVARALHNSGVLRHDQCRWINQFAEKPGAAEAAEAVQ